MTATWPVTLPQALLLAGNEEGMPDGRLRSQTDTGPGKVRQRSLSTARPLNGSMLMTEAQIAILEAFVTDDLVGGSLPFDFPAQRGEGTWLVRFSSGLPIWSNLGAGNWSVSLPLEVLR